MGNSSTAIATVLYQTMQWRSVLICRTDGFARHEEIFMWRWGHLVGTLDAPVLAHTLAVCFWKKGATLFPADACAHSTPVAPHQ